MGPLQCASVCIGRSNLDDDHLFERPRAVAAGHVVGRDLTRDDVVFIADERARRCRVRGAGFERMRR